MYDEGVRGAPDKNDDKGLAYQGVQMHDVPGQHRVCFRTQNDIVQKIHDSHFSEKRRNRPRHAQKSVYTNHVLIYVPTEQE